MLKEAETEETIGFLSHFYHWCHFTWGSGAGPLHPNPQATSMISTWYTCAASTVQVSQSCIDEFKKPWSATALLSGTPAGGQGGKLPLLEIKMSSIFYV